MAGADAWIAVAAGAGYFLGSIPFGLLLARLTGRGDIRRIGSGNIGATNVLRTGSKTLAAATLVLDAGKGAAAVLLATLLAATANGSADHLVTGLATGLVAGGFAVVGHVFPVWLGFRGGKGVATAFGVLLAAQPLTGVLAIGVWIGTAALSRLSSLAALVAMAAAPLIAWGSGHDAVAGLALAISLLVIARHHENIRRMIAGKEPRIGKSGGGKPNNGHE